MKGKVESYNKTHFVVIKIYDNRTELDKELEIIHRLKGSESYVPEVHCHFYNPINYLVMKEFGTSLNRFYSKKLKSDFQLEIAKQIISSLIWLHSKDIVHCDLKPDNILVEEEGGGFANVKLCDFDSATVEGGNFPSGVDNNNGVKVLKFTKLWVSPEVYSHNCFLRNNPERRVELIVRKSMDIFPLGLVLVCLFSEERSPTKTILTNNLDDSEYHESLTNPQYLRNKIINILRTSSLSVTILDTLLSVCSIDSSSRGSLINLLKSIEENTRTGLQKAVNQFKSEDDVKEVLGRIESKFDDTRAAIGNISTTLEEKLS